CDSLSEIVIPSSVTSIGDWAFSSCDSLSEIVIPSSVTSIGDDAFYNCYFSDNLKQELISRFGDKIF
ncbi:leucine-rich repeat protein, partial [Segatella copri]|uniref:leucine-rich repeat protein n=2 Tax=Segatella TaxID=2974251 RepID=UPI00129183E7